MPTLKEAIHIGKKMLGVEYVLDIELLLAFLLTNGDRSRLLTMEPSKVINNDLFYDYIELIERRKKHEPISQILGYRYFWDYKFVVDKNVLTPRPDTEIIIEKTLKFFPNTSAKLAILDLGTGSGCLAVTLAGIYNNSIVDAIDISQYAIFIAKKNADSIGVSKRINFILSNWFDNVDNSKKYDLIVSNPPYIPIDAWQNLMPDVKNYEPFIALSDGRDGLTYYRNIAKSAHEYMLKSSHLIIEFGIGQEKAIPEIFSQYELVEVSKDLANIYRCASFRIGRHDCRGIMQD